MPEEVKVRAPLVELTLARVRGLVREPEAIFWVYGFPLIMTLVLGIAFREKKTDDPFLVDIEEGPHADFVEKSLAAQGERFKVKRAPFAECKKRLRNGKTSLVVQSEPITGADVPYVIAYLSDPVRPESSLAEKAVDDVLQNAKGRQDPVKHVSHTFNEPGGRYIDFLVPGLLGMGLMGGGLFGVGFAIVDMRIRKLLKRFLATPMRRPDFLLAVMTSRFVFMLPEVIMLLVFSYFIFDVKITGSILLMLFCIFLGGVTFSGIGLLVGVLINRRGQEIAIQTSAAPIRDRAGHLIGAVIVFHDVSRERRLHRALHYQASHDALTGLINRREFEHRLNAAVENVRQDAQSQHALLYLDLDQFKIVNDTCGHAAGDRLLREVSHLLSRHVRASDVLARLGGDEFGVLLRDCPLENAREIAAPASATGFVAVFPIASPAKTNAWAAIKAAAARPNEMRFNTWVSPLKDVCGI